MSIYIEYKCERCGKKMAKSDPPWDRAIAAALESDPKCTSAATVATTVGSGTNNASMVPTTSHPNYGSSVFSSRYYNSNKGHGIRIVDYVCPSCGFTKQYREKL